MVLRGGSPSAYISLRDVLWALDALPSMVYEERKTRELTREEVAEKSNLHGSNAVDRLERGEPVMITEAIMLLRWLDRS